MASNNWVRVITAAAAVGLLFPMAVLGQGRGGTTAPPSAGTGGTTGSPGGAPTTGRPTTPSPTTSPTSPTTTPSPANIPQPIFVRGRVVMEDGTEAPSSVVIETVCNGSPHAEGYTDAKGYFAIELGARNGVIQDASEFGSRGNRNTTGMTGTSGTSGSLGSSERKYMGCDLQAKLGGYRSQTVPLTGRRPMDDPNVGTILLHRNGPAEEGKTISA